LIEMKDLSELALDLGYSSILYYNEDIAQEVYYLEEKIDNLKIELQKWVLKTVRTLSEDESFLLIPLLDIAYSSEVIADAAKSIAGIVINKLEIHPIFRDVMRGGDEIITIVEVKELCELDGKTLGEAKVETRTGMHIIAIKRDNKWITKPKANTRVFAGDILFAKGTREGEELLKKLCLTALQKQV